MLKKTLYNLKQWARELYLFIKSLLKEFNFETITIDQSIFINIDLQIIIAAHINHLLVLASKIDDINLLRAKIEIKVKIFNLGPAKFFLGIEINCNRKDKILSLSQSKYINKLLNIFNIIGDESLYSFTVQDIRLEKLKEKTDVKDSKTYQ